VTDGPNDQPVHVGRCHGGQRTGCPGRSHG
jgi:hypothetical protein